jgi:hypothetical protein
VWQQGCCRYFRVVWQQGCCRYIVQCSLQLLIIPYWVINLEQKSILTHSVLFQNI